MVETRVRPKEYKAKVKIKVETTVTRNVYPEQYQTVDDLYIQARKDALTYLSKELGRLSVKETTFAISETKVLVEIVQE